MAISRGTQGPSLLLLLICVLEGESRNLSITVTRPGGCFAPRPRGSHTKMFNAFKIDQQTDWDRHVLWEISDQNQQSRNRFDTQTSHTETQMVTKKRAFLPVLK